MAKTKPLDAGDILNRMNEVAAAVRETTGQLERLADPNRAEGEKRYLKSELDHYGVPVPACRRIARNAARSLDGAGHDGMVAVVRALWAEPTHECRLVGALILEARVDGLSAADTPLLEELVRASGTWALVDVLAAKVASNLAMRDPRAVEAYRTWVADEQQWLRRAGILGYLVPASSEDAGETYLRQFLAVVDPVLTDRRFFVRKAIGWVLRTAARTRPTVVEQWLAQRTDRVSGVTLREAVRHLDEPAREALLTAYRRARSR